MSFKFKQRQKYEKEAKRKLSEGELTQLASAEWKQLPQSEKDAYKDMVKGMRSSEPSSVSSFKNETSNHRLDTEGQTISCIMM